MPFSERAVPLWWLLLESLSTWRYTVWHSLHLWLYSIGWVHYIESDTVYIPHYTLLVLLFVGNLCLSKGCQNKWPLIKCTITSGLNIWVKDVAYTGTSWRIRVAFVTGSDLTSFLVITSNIPSLLTDWCQHHRLPVSVHRSDLIDLSQHHM